MISLICGILKNDTEQKQTYGHRKQVYGSQKGERGQEGLIRSLGLADKKLLHIK